MAQVQQRTRREIVFSAADATAGTTRVMVAHAAGQLAASAVFAPGLSQLAGWAVAESMKYMTERIVAAVLFRKFCKDLSGLLQGSKLKEFLESLDTVADSGKLGYVASREKLILLCDVIADVSLMLAEYEANSKLRRGKVWQSIKGALTWKKKHALKNALEEVLAHASTLVQSIAANCIVRAGRGGYQMLPQTTGEHTSARAGMPDPVKPFFQHGGELVPCIQGFLASTRTVGIVGMPGIGKTAVARAVVARVRASKQFNRAVWLSVGSAPDVLELLSSAFRKLSKLELDAPVPFTDPGGGFTELTGLIEKKGWSVLLVLDDVTPHTPAAALKSLNFVANEASTKGSRLLITSRQRSSITIQRDAGGERIEIAPECALVEVPRLLPSQAQMLFRHHALGAASRDLQQTAQVVRWLEDCQQLIEDCGGNPGILCDVARRMGSKDDEAARGDAFREMQTMLDDWERGTMRACAESVKSLCPSARDCFIVCAAFRKESWISQATLLHLFATHAPLHTAESLSVAAQKLDWLVDCHLLSVRYCRDSCRPEYSMHRIFHRIAMRLAVQDDLRKDAWCFHSMPDAAAEIERLRYLSLHGSANCMKDTLKKFCKHSLFACIMSDATSSGSQETKLPRKLQLLHLKGQLEPAGTPGEARPSKSQAYLLNSVCLEDQNENASHVLLKCILPAGQLMHLDLSECASLKQLPSCIGDCTGLLHLNLSGCTALQELPLGLSHCKRLTDLDLSGCAVLEHAHLPCNFGERGNLTRLSLRGCEQLQELPSGIRRCYELAHLDARSCMKLSTVPKGLFNDLTVLSHLDFSGCSNLEISSEKPASLSGCTALGYLGMGKCSRLSDLPQGIAGCTGPASHSHNSCPSLQQQPAHLTDSGMCIQLTQLDLSDCCALQLPDCLRFSSSLVRVSLAGLDFPELPQCMLNHTHLTNLNLSQCTSLQQLPPAAWGGWANLAVLTLEACSTLALKDPEACQATSSGCQACMQSQPLFGQMIHLDLSKCSNMTELPAAIGKCSMLTRLILRACTNLKTLPDMGGCLRLSHLDLSKCSALTGLPRCTCEEGEVTRMASVVYLSLEQCSTAAMRNLDWWISPALMTLDLSGCSRLTSLPNSIEFCSRLEVLDLDKCNALRFLPDGIVRCFNLQRLVLGKVALLTRVPDAFWLLPAAREYQHVRTCCKEVTRAQE